jgi:hypothetical protein
VSGLDVVEITLVFEAEAGRPPWQAVVRAEYRQASGAEQAELLSRHLAYNRRQFPGAELIAGDSQKTRCGRIKSRARRECGCIVHRREIHALVRIAPVEDSL